MTGDLFKKAVEKASELPPEQQDAIGSIILLELEDEARWANLLNSNPDALRKLGDEALKEFREGKTRPMPGDSDSADLAS